MLGPRHDEALAQFAVSGFRRPDESLFATAWRHILDTWAVTIAGSATSVSERFRATLPVTGEGARVFGSQARYAPKDAAAINGMAGHVHDYDDDDPNLCVGHASIAVVAALSAVSESMDLAVRDFLAAYLVGIETTMHVGRMVNPSHYNRGWHCTSTLGVIGAASAVGALRGSAVQEVAIGLRLAATMSLGLKANFGTDAKPLQVGLAAGNGVWAADLARAGMSVGENSLFGPKGLVDLNSDANADEDAWDRFGNPWGIVRPGMNIKLYPCCSSTHTAVDGILVAMKEGGLMPDQVERIDVWIGEDVPGILIHDVPANGMQGKFSMRYCAAAAAAHGALTLASFTDEAVRRESVVGMMKRTHVHVDPSLPREETGVTHQSRVVITSVAGTRIQKEYAQPYGSASRPISQEDLQGKFMSCVQPVVGGPRAANLWSELAGASFDGPMQAVFDALYGARS